MQHEKDAALFAAIKEFWANDRHIDICEGEDPDGLDIECAGVQAQIQAYDESAETLAKP
ncbi:MAG: hypothetical protein JOY71_18885 [Acetobacteraceae bacterium]|nr:hypothetical protein [Acetobacteraceae bacterium]